jgi:tripartite-type tricarboxylate transporter receptor subunit TctC
MIRSLALAFLFVASLSANALAQNWPSARSIRFIVPFPAGGSTDIVARLFAEEVSKDIGQSIVVENITGASGNIGTSAAVKSAPDGYTVLIAPDGMASSAHLFKIDFDPLNDVIPVIQLTSQPVVLAVHPSLGVNSLAELVALAKTNTKELSYATSGVGSQQHLVGEWLAKLSGMKMTHIPYRGGGQAINDLVAGHVQIGSLGSAPVIPYHTSGKLKIIAQSTKSRSASLNEVPTYGEAGFPDIIIDQWVSVFLPAKTAPEVAQKLNASMQKAMASPKIKAILLRSGLDPVGGTAAEATALLNADYEKYGRLVKELGMKPASQ